MKMKQNILIKNKIKIPEKCGCTCCTVLILAAPAYRQQERFAETTSLFSPAHTFWIVTSEVVTIRIRGLLAPEFLEWSLAHHSHSNCRISTETIVVSCRMLKMRSLRLRIKVLSIIEEGRTIVVRMRRNNG
ncbi:hypothetical protein R1flu_003441 [Riccia fluitans]|uniref:Uncharacterized protein n=1 Tax=Riccia fluitans TaxID=41844 RepID=A0ABD1Y9D9_9MARC